MKIVRLSVKNFKKITAVEITPDGNVITITGKNGAGKSSVLDAIFSTLCGAAGALERPIHGNAVKGSVEIDLGEYIVKKIFTNKSAPKLEVKRADGAVIIKPQTVLDAMFTAVSFDPADFLAMKPKEQRATLLSMIDLKPDWSTVDFRVDEKLTPLEALEAARSATFSERTDINREVKRLEGTLDTMRLALPQGADGIKRESVAELTSEYEAAVAAHRDNRDKMHELTAIGNTIVTLKEKIKRLNAEIADATQELIGSEEDAKRITIKAAAELPDLAVIKGRMNAAEQNNRTVDAVERVKATQKEYSKTALKADELTARLEAIDHYKEYLLENSAMPVVGLGIDAECLTFNGVPLSQASHAERLRVSILIGMASNPALRVMRISDGEKFDADAWAIIHEIAETNDFQVWIEKMMDEPGNHGSIFIVDGSVAGADDAEIDSELEDEKDGE